MKHAILETTAVRVINDKSDRSLFPPRLSDLIKDRYSFVEYPKSVEEYSGGAGLQYRYGYYGDFIIDKAVVYNDAIFVTASVHSDRLDVLIDDIILQIEGEFSVTLDKTNAISLYNSKIEIEAGGGFSGWLKQLEPVQRFLESAARRNGIDVKSYEVGGVSVSGEGDGDIKPGRFLFERRVNHPFGDNMFFSEAPLSTSEHFGLISEISGSFG